MSMTSDAAGAVMTIGELARRTGMSVKAVRRLEGLGLIFTVGRSRAGYRLFGSEALWCVQDINSLRGLGLTLAEICQLRDIYFSQPDRPYLAELLSAARVRVDARIAELEALRRRIDDFEERHQPELARCAIGGLFAENPRSNTRGACACLSERPSRSE